MESARVPEVHGALVPGIMVELSTPAELLRDKLKEGGDKSARRLGRHWPLPEQVFNVATPGLSCGRYCRTWEENRGHVGCCTEQEIFGHCE